MPAPWQARQMLLLALLLLAAPRHADAATNDLTVKASISGSKRGKLAVVDPGQSFTLNVLVRKRSKTDTAVLIVNAPDGALYQGPSDTLPGDPAVEQQADASSTLTWDLSAFPVRKLKLQINMAADSCACPASLAFQVSVSEDPSAGSSSTRGWGNGKVRKEKEKSSRTSVSVKGGLSASQVAGINRALTAPCNIIGCDKCNDDASACLRCLDPTVWTLSNGTCGK
jgi:hypothetical protein